MEHRQEGQKIICLIKLKINVLFELLIRNNTIFCNLGYFEPTAIKEQPKLSSISGILNNTGYISKLYFFLYIKFFKICLQNFLFLYTINK